MKQGIQHGRPQMTIADLLGSPLPNTAINTARFQDIQIAWRRWLGMRVKIIRRVQPHPHARAVPRCSRSWRTTTP
ncbi:MAG: hypothetical protein IPI43_11295 [Sandaracinaceae bacterium]|nr:hypothetical protein [Sandaracinaceae bacterium]